MCGHPPGRVKQRGSAEHIGPRCDPERRLYWAAIFVAITVSACAGGHATDPVLASPRLIAEAWPEAETSFRSDDAWLGGDGALSIPLDDARTLWLFGDSFVVDGSLPPAARSGRAGAVMVRNSIAIQEGSDLSSARLRFHARTDERGRPSAFFSEVGASDTWLWPGHGLRTPSGLVVFMHRMARDDAEGGLGFRPAGALALSITGIDRAPRSWQVTAIPLPPLPSAGLVGAAVLQDGPYVYAFGVRDPGDRALTLVRWAAASFASGDLAAAEVWTGEDGFMRGGEAAALLAPVSTELSVTADPRGSGHGFVLMHSQGFGLAPIAVRFARTLEGPWSEPATIDLAPYVEPSGDTLVYAAKAHPEQRGAEWVVTYAVNSLDGTRVWRDLSIYFPRVLRVRRSPRKRSANAPARRSRAWPKARARAPLVRSRTTYAAYASPQARC